MGDLSWNPKIRKRRRQQYHAKTSLKPMKRKATIDQGVFTEQLKAPRKVVSIQKKLDALELYDKLKAEKLAALEKLQEPRPVGVTLKKRKAFRAERKEMLKKMRRNIQKECEKAFPYVKGSRMSCWKARSQAEGWLELPAVLRSRLSATPNTWRKRFDIPKKGPKAGGGVPIQLQRELDVLMVEMASGSSDVAERREIVSVDDIVTRLLTKLIVKRCTLTQPPCNAEYKKILQPPLQDKKTFKMIIFT